jgi:hypothetical protein
MSDKTNWRSMLKNERDSSNLKSSKDQAKNFIPSNLLHYFIDASNVVSIDYPVVEYPENPKSIKLNKDSVFSSTLMGVKGQYLIFEKNQVLNYRAHEGHIFKIEIEY